MSEFDCFGSRYVFFYNRERLANKVSSRKKLRAIAKAKKYIFKEERKIIIIFYIYYISHLVTYTAAFRNGVTRI